MKSLNVLIKSRKIELGLKIGSTVHKRLEFFELFSDEDELVIFLAFVVRLDRNSVLKVQSKRVDQIIDDDKVFFLPIREESQVLDV